MLGVFIGLLTGLEIKHYIGDYLLQPGWMIAGKGDLTRPGGYVHAGIHAGLTLAVLLVFGTPLGLALAIFAAEFVVHYALDYAKMHYSRGVNAGAEPKRYWAMHGLDQLGHQLTYAAILFAVMRAQGLA